MTIFGQLPDSFHEVCIEDIPGARPQTFTDKILRDFFKEQCKQLGEQRRVVSTFQEAQDIVGEAAKYPRSPLRLEGIFDNPIARSPVGPGQEVRIWIEVRRFEPGAKPDVTTTSGVEGFFLQTQNLLKVTWSDFERKVRAKDHRQFLPRERAIVLIEYDKSPASNSIVQLVVHTHSYRVRTFHASHLRHPTSKAGRSERYQPKARR